MTTAVPDLAMGLARQVARITDESIQSIRRQRAIKGHPDAQLNAFADVRCPPKGNVERRISAGQFNPKE